MHIEDRSSSGGYIVITEATQNELLAIRQYCRDNNLVLQKYPELLVGYAQIVLWQSRPFTASGNFSRNGFVGKAQDAATRKLAKTVINDLRHIDNQVDCFC